MSELKKILVIDDEEDFCLVMKDTLEERGDYSVEYTTNPLEAEQKVAACQPDLILLDNIMPQKHGSDVVKSLKSNPDFKDIPIIMVSGRGEMVYIKKKNTFKWMPNTQIVKERGEISDEKGSEALSEAYGVDDYVSKPVDAETMLGIIEDVLD